MSEHAKKEDKPSAGAKPQLLEKPALRGLFTAMALVAPAPLLLALSDFWLKFLAPDAMKKMDPLALCKQLIEGTGDPPSILLLVAFLLPVILLTVMYRRKSGVLLGMLLALVAATAAEVFFFLQITQG